ncbi:DUF412 family protein [Shigella flexneri]
MSTPKIARELLSLFRRGQRCSKTWPMENASRRCLLRIAVSAHAPRHRFMPPIAIFTLCWQIA